MEPGAPRAPRPITGKVMSVARPEGQIRKAAEELSQAEDDDAKAEAEEKLNELLDSYFEEDMEHREQELADVEARVKKLRELMERRREKKQDIIALQMQVLVNEADGLGFFGHDAPRGQNSPFGMDLFAAPVPSRVGQPPEPPRAVHRDWYGFRRVEAEKKKPAAAKSRKEKADDETE